MKFLIGKFVLDEYCNKTVFEFNIRIKKTGYILICVLHFRLSDAFELQSFILGDYIVRQGTSGDTFYIITEGQVRITRRVEGKYVTYLYTLHQCKNLLLYYWLK